MDNNLTNLNIDKLEGVASSVDSELVLFSGVGGKTIKRATTTGMLKAASGVVAAATAGTDFVAPGTATTFTATQNFAASGATLKGSSTGITTFTSANASATNYTVTFPAATTSIPVATQTITWSGPSTARTYTLPDANATLLTSNAAVTVAQGGTGRATSTTAYGLIAAGTTATGAHQTLAAGTAGQLLKSGGAAALPEWDTTTGIAKLTSGVVSAATAGTDFVAPGTATTFTAQQTFKELKDTVHTITDGAAFEIDPANGSVQIVTLGASRSPLFTNFEAGQTVLLGIDDGTAYSITWPTMTWVKSGGTASAPTLATSGYTWVLIWEVGTTMYGALVGSP
jgi:hypothetical protein